MNKMTQNNTPVKTQYFHQIIPNNLATEMFEYLKNNVGWYQGVQIASENTRLVCHVDWGDEMGKTITPLAVYVLKMCKIEFSKLKFGYLNYCRNGDDWIPNHSHQGVIRIIISLGAKRTLKIA